MQATLLGTYSNGIIELDEPIEEENGHRVAVVFLDSSKTKERVAVKMSVNKMCGVFAGRVPVYASDDFAKRKREEMELEV